MNVEYEEFSSIEDMLLFLASAAPPMKNFMPINLYKGFVCSFIPLSQSGGETYLMLYTKSQITSSASGTPKGVKFEQGIHEFDITTKTIKKVEAIERADKSYFIVITPIRNTIADKAIEQM